MTEPHPASVSHEAAMVAMLRQDPDFAEEYVRVALEEATDPEGEAVLLKALRQVAEARGVTKVAEQAGLKRESLSRALSTRGNPRFTTLLAITRALGLTLTVKQATHG